MTKKRLTSRWPYRIGVFISLRRKDWSWLPGAGGEFGAGLYLYWLCFDLEAEWT